MISRLAGGMFGLALVIGDLATAGADLVGKLLLGVTGGFAQLRQAFAKATSTKRAEIYIKASFRKYRGRGGRAW